MTKNTREREALVTVREVARFEEALDNQSSTTVSSMHLDPRTENPALSDNRTGRLSPGKYGKALVRIAGRLMAIYDRLFGPPSTEQDRSMRTSSKPGMITTSVSAAR